ARRFSQRLGLGNGVGDRLLAGLGQGCRRIVVGKGNATALVDAERHRLVENLAGLVDVAHAHGKRVGYLVGDQFSFVAAVRVVGEIVARIDLDAGGLQV